MMSAAECSVVSPTGQIFLAIVCKSSQSARSEEDAYGERTVEGGNGRSSIGLTTAFTGRALDEETGLYYFRNRMYSGKVGRFVSRDPMGYVDGMSLYRGYFVPGAMDPEGTRDIVAIYDTDFKPSESQDAEIVFGAMNNEIAYVNFSQLQLKPMSIHYTSRATLDSQLKAIKTADCEAVTKLTVVSHANPSSIGGMKSTYGPIYNLGEWAEMLNEHLALGAPVILSGCNTGVSGEGGEKSIAEKLAGELAQGHRVYGSNGYMRTRAEAGKAYQKVYATYAEMKADGATAVNVPMVNGTYPSYVGAKSSSTDIYTGFGGM